MFFGKIFGSIEVNNSPVFEVELVSDEYDIRVFTVCMRLKLADPVAHVEERELACQIEHKDKTHGVSKESRGQTAKSLLTGRVPQLQVYSMRAAV